jgi:hypothetical protein
MHDDNKPMPNNHGYAQDSQTIEHLKKSLTTAHYKQTLQNTQTGQGQGSSDQSSGSSGQSSQENQ